MDRKLRAATARLAPARAGLARLAGVVAEHRIADELLQPWRSRQEQRIAQLANARDPDGEGLAQARSLNRVELALIRAERERLNALLREDQISDEIRRRIERDLDLDEERLRRNARGIVADD
jgi:CPA1 family monovalent cation:H+ antiporter